VVVFVHSKRYRDCLRKGTITSQRKKLHKKIIIINNNFNYNNLSNLYNILDVVYGRQIRTLEGAAAFEMSNSDQRLRVWSF